MTEPVVIKKRGGPYKAKPVYASKDAWFYTNGGSITVITQGTGGTVSCNIPLRTLKRVVAAMGGK